MIQKEVQSKKCSNLATECACGLMRTRKVQ